MLYLFRFSQKVMIILSVCKYPGIKPSNLQAYSNFEICNTWISESLILKSQTDILISQCSNSKTYPPFSASTKK